MSPNKLVPFKIASMDSLGQGVSKEADRITFIPKTLPGDEGDAFIVAQRKGVQFGSLKTLHRASKQRVDSICPHFENCPSCHYLHTDYESEIAFKALNLEKMFYKIPHPEIIVTRASKRVGYRNRIQLHYDKKLKLLGMFDAKTHDIFPIPECLIGNDVVTKSLKSLYENQQWLKEAAHLPNQGHVEIYERSNVAQIVWNQPYAQGGFTQVFDEMNQKLKKILKDWSASKPKAGLLDLFAGNGNMSQELNFSDRLCVDLYQTQVENPFFNQDLYAPSALKNLQNELKRKNLQPTTLILDPPRSGLRNLSEWTETFKPQFIAYVSCDPHTLIRDLSGLKSYHIEEVHLIDFFPSTFHFESMIFLERK